MLLSCSTAEADTRAQAIDVRGERYVLRGYVGAAPVRGTYIDGNESNDNGLPQGFLVDQPPGAITRPHFHEHNQFQVFVAGSGRFGKQPARPLTVQYASGHTPYGPIVAGDEGLRYFTLRQRWDPGAKYMPAMRDRLVRGRQRQCLMADIAMDDEAGLGRRTEAAFEVLHGPHDDGLLAAMLRLGPHASHDTPAPADGHGQYHLVVGGSLVHAGVEYPPLSCQYLSEDEPAPRVRAGAGGLQMLILRFPPAVR